VHPLIPAELPQGIFKRFQQGKTKGKTNKAEEKSKAETNMTAGRIKIYWGALIITSVVYLSLMIGSLLVFRWADSAIDYLLSAGLALASKPFFFGALYSVKVRVHRW